jgi:hypothetical protein
MNMCHEEEISRDSLWKQLYVTAVFEHDPEVLQRRAEIARKSIHAEIVKLQAKDDAGELWELMDALRNLEDLVRKNGKEKPSVSSSHISYL